MNAPAGARDPEYLGDGVYVANDGYHLLLWLGDGGPPGRPIALEPPVLDRLERYRLKVFGSGSRS